MSIIQPQRGRAAVSDSGFVQSVRRAARRWILGPEWRFALYCWTAHTGKHRCQTGDRTQSQAKQKAHTSLRQFSSLGFPGALEKGSIRLWGGEQDQSGCCKTLRHTFLMRLGESGCDAWTLARIAGHNSIAIPNRYVHPSEDAVLNAMAKLGGHKIGNSDNKRQRMTLPDPCYRLDHRQDIWWAVQDSNLRPPACKAGALTN